MSCTCTYIYMYNHVLYIHCICMYFTCLAVPPVFVARQVTTRCIRLQPDTYQTQEYYTLCTKQHGHGNRHSEMHSNYNIIHVQIYMYKYMYMYMLVWLTWADQRHRAYFKSFNVGSILYDQYWTFNNTIISELLGKPMKSREQGIKWKERHQCVTAPAWLLEAYRWMHVAEEG